MTYQPQRYIKVIQPIIFPLAVLSWYASSALTNTSTKSILNIFPYPVTLTFIQFGLVSVCCGLCSLWRPILPPSRNVITTTIPLSLFQILGHVFSSVATKEIPVSTVHTIKALSPLFTVVAYRFLFGIHYSISTYISLIPLISGVVLACSFQMSTHLFGLLCALSATLIFVSQNIFSKKLLFEGTDHQPHHLSSQKLDKLNLLFYSSLLSFLFMAPAWLHYEGLSLFRSTTVTIDRSLQYNLLMNGVSHFAQCFLAFTLLGLVSPVTYSIASLVKRIFVIVASIIWFGQSTTAVQALGILLTFFGLWLYDRAKVDVARGERKVQHKIDLGEGLPIQNENKGLTLRRSMSNGRGDEHEKNSRQTSIEA